jgi:hypothetical protein
LCFLEELLRPCRVNLGLNGKAKFKDGKKYHKRLQPSKSSGGQRVGSDQQEAKDTLEGSNRQHRCMLCNCVFVHRESMVEHMHKNHAGFFIVCKHNGVCTQIFRTEAEKSEHIIELRNKNVKLTKCDFCCLMYYKRDRLNHFKKHHKNDNLIRCSYWRCSLRFRSELEKQNHEALVHALTKKQKCLYCNLFFTDNAIVVHYQTIHKTLFANAFKCKYH